MAAELLHADGQTDTDMTNLIVVFRNFANSPNKIIQDRHCNFRLAENRASSEETLLHGVWNMAFANFTQLIVFRERTAVRSDSRPNKEA